MIELPVVVFILCILVASAGGWLSRGSHKSAEHLKMMQAMEREILELRRQRGQ